MKRTFIAFYALFLVILPLTGVPQTLVEDSIDQVTCFGDCDGAAYVSVSGGTAPYTYQWDDPAGQTMQDLSGVCAGTYEVVVTDDNGDMDSLSVTVGEPAPLQVFPSSDTTICIGGTATLFANASGGTPPYTYHWDQGLGTGKTHAVSPGDPTNYAVYVEDDNGCTSDPDTVLVSYYDSLEVSIRGDRSVCPGDSVQLVADPSGGEGPPYDHTWSTGGKTPGEFVTPSSTTSYSVTVDDACETPPVEDSIEVEVNPLPAVAIDGYDLESCSPVEAKLINATPPADVGGDCVWDLGDGTEKVGCDTITHVYEEPGCYDVTLTLRSPDGCVDSTTRTNYVCVRPHPDVDFDVDPPSSNVQDPHFDFLNRTTGASSYEWSFGEMGSSTDEHPSYSFPNDREGTYEVCLTATSPHGCDDRSCREVTVEGEFILYVPNAFTPNGDGVNDEFGPVVQGANESEYSFQIYDRWGELVFETTDPNERWDGMVNGSSPKKSDVYVWRVVAKNRYTGEDIERTGEVTIVR